MDNGEQERPLSPAERRQRNRDEMIAAILVAARAIMREQGVAALNLNEVARRVGLRPQSLYEYFPSKMAIYDTLFAVAVRAYRERLERVWHEHGPGWSRLRAWFEARMAFAHEHPELDRLFLGREVPGFVPSEASMAESRAIVAAATAAIAEIIDAGVIAPNGSPERATDLFLAVMTGITALHMANEPDLPVGTGRFGGLIPEAIALFEASWTPERQKDPARMSSGTARRAPTSRSRTPRDRSGRG